MRERIKTAFQGQEGKDEKPKVVLGQYRGICIPKRKDSQDGPKQRENDILQVLIQNAEITQAETMVVQTGKRMAEEFANRLSQQGLSLEKYYEMTGQEEQGLLHQLLPVAEKRVKGRLVLEAVAKAEGLGATEEEYERELKKLSDIYITPVPELRRLLHGEEEQRLRTDIAIAKAVAFVMAEAVET